MGKDALQVPMDPPEFMLAPLSMTVAEYVDRVMEELDYIDRVHAWIMLTGLWRHGTDYVDRVREELNYDEFNYTCLILPLLSRSAPSSYLFPFLLSSYCQGTLKQNACTRQPLLLVFLSTLFICLG